MNIIRRKKHFMYFLGFIYMILPIFSHASDDYSAYSVNAYLKHNGELSVKEEFIFDYGTNEKHGIFRNIPLVINNEKSWFEIKSISVKNKDNEPYLFESSDSGNVAKIKIGDPNITLTGTHYYNLEYTLTNIGKADSTSWKIIGKIREPIRKLQANFYLPKPLAPGLTSASCLYNKDEVPVGCVTIPILRSGYVIGYTIYLENITNEEILFHINYPEGIIFPSTLDDNNTLIISKKVFIFILASIFIAIVSFFIFKYKSVIFKNRTKKIYVSPESYPYICRAMVYKNRIGEEDIIANIIDLNERGYILLEQRACDVGINEFVDYEIQIIDEDLPSRAESLLLKELNKNPYSLYEWINNELPNCISELESLASDEIHGYSMTKNNDELPKLIGFKK